MVIHIYLYKLTDRKYAAAACEKLMTLKESFGYMKYMETGMDYRHADNSYDIAEICVFDSMEDFKRFGDEPYHEEVRQFMKQITAKGAKIDYIRE